MADLNAQLNELIGKVKNSLTPILVKIGLIKKTDSSVPVQGSKSSSKKTVEPKTKFNFEMFIQATRKFWTEFMEKKIPDFFKNGGIYFQKYPSWFGLLETDEKIAHVGVYLGVVCLIVGIVLAFV